MSDLTGVLLKRRAWRQPVFLVACFLLAFFNRSAAAKATADVDTGKKAGTVYFSGDSISREDAEAIFMEAVTAKITGDKDLAFDKYSILAAHNKLGATPHYELSSIWLQRNNIPRALTEIKRAVELDSANKWFQVQYADLLAYDGQYLKAASVFHQLAEKDRHPEDYLMREAFLYKKAEHYREALAVTDKLKVLLGEDDEGVLLERQQLFLNLNDVEGAAGEIKKLIQFYPYESKYMILLAEIYQNNGFEQKADKVFKDLEVKFPEDIAAQFALVMFYLKREDEANYTRYLRKVIVNKEASLDDRIKLVIPLLQFKEKHQLAMELSGILAHTEPGQVNALQFYSFRTVQRRSW